MTNVRPDRPSPPASLSTVVGCAGHAARVAAMLMLCAIAPACSSGGTVEPDEDRGTLVVQTATTGPVDSDGYVVEGISPTRTIQANSEVVIPNLSAGTRTISLGGVTSTCEPQTADSVTVTIEADETSTVVFELACTVQIVYFTGDGGPGVSAWNASIDGDTAANFLFRHPGSMWSPAFSPDGTRLAYAEGNFEEDVANLRIRNLSSGEVDVVLDDHMVYDLAWLPDGDRIAYIRWGWGIYVLDLSTGVTDQVSSHEYAYSLDVSPADSRVAFRDFDTLLVMNPDGSNVTSFEYEHREDQGDNPTPQWSPDGTRIAFSTNDLGDYIIRVVNPDGPEREVPYRQEGGMISLEDWSPDGDWFLVSDLGGLYRLRSDGSDTTRVRLGGDSAVQGGCRLEPGHPLALTYACHDPPLFTAWLIPLGMHDRRAGPPAEQGNTVDQREPAPPPAGAPVLGA